MRHDRYEPRAHVKATIDSGPPKAMLRPPRAPAARVARREAQAEAAVSDIKMIENIAREMARPPSLSVLERKGPMSLNTNQRRKELQRIDHENQKLLKRLENQKSCYAHRDQKRAYEESRRHAALVRAWPRGQNGQNACPKPERMQALPVSPVSSAPQVGALPRRPPRQQTDQVSRPSLKRPEESKNKGVEGRGLPKSSATCVETPPQREAPVISGGEVAAPQDVARHEVSEAEERVEESMWEELPEARDLTPSHIEEELPKEPSAAPQVDGYSEDEEFYDDSDGESEVHDPMTPAEEDTSTHLNSEVRSMEAPEEDASSKEASALAQSLASKALSISPDEGASDDGASMDSEDCFAAAGAILPREKATNAADLPVSQR